MRDEVRQKMPLTASHVAASSCERMNAVPDWSLQPTSVPTLAIYPKRSMANWSSWASAPPLTDLRCMFTNLRCEQWEGVGHFLMLVKPEVFNQTVLSFFEQL